MVLDVTWELFPANLTNPIDVAAGQPAVYRARPNRDMPAPHAGNAASGAVNLHRMLRDMLPALKPYMLIPRQIVYTMLAQHDVATGDDISKLRDPLSQAMTLLSDLTKHIASFLLASQRLNRSGQGETAYRYFQLFLETVANFPSVAQSLTTYYAQYPVIPNQSVATLFPFLE